MSKPSIVFFGTGPVAAKSLELLLENFDVEAVITKPKPTHHRGSFPVLDVSSKNGLKVVEVTDKKSASEAIKNSEFSSKLAILIDFGIIITKDVIETFEKGIVNSHFSLLPQWRGADPITFAILSGQEKTGVSLMLVVEGMDEGPLLAVGEQPLNGSETTSILTESLIQLSDALLKKEVPRYLSGASNPVTQAEMSELIEGYPSEASYSRKLTKADGILDFKKPAEQLEREIRAFAGWPKSRTRLGDIEVVITKAHVVPSIGSDCKPGDITVFKEANELGVATHSGTLWIDRIQPVGKKEMSVADFLRGYGTRL